MERVYVRDLGKMDYQQAWDYQEKLLQQNVAIKALRWKQSPASAQPAEISEPYMATDTMHHLLLLEHPPVYTLGKSGKEEHLLLNREQMEQKGYGYYHINRGGDITFHGPGQIVGYPILDLEKFYTDIGRYLRNLEEVIIRTMAYYGIKGERSPGETGVWIDAAVKGKERKICAIGIRCSRWVTMHGFAFNVNTDLSYFENIVPCGIQGKQVTSLHKEIGSELPLHEVKTRLLFYFSEVFEVDLAYQEEAALLSST